MLSAQFKSVHVPVRFVLRDSPILYWFLWPIFSYSILRFYRYEYIVILPSTLLYAPLILITSTVLYNTVHMYKLLCFHNLIQSATSITSKSSIFLKVQCIRAYAHTFVPYSEKFDA